MLINTYPKQWQWIPNAEEIWMKRAFPVACYQVCNLTISLEFVKVENTIMPRDFSCFWALSKKDKKFYCTFSHEKNELWRIWNARKLTEESSRKDKDALR